jgi:hypothetical protein
MSENKTNQNSPHCKLVRKKCIDGLRFFKFSHPPSCQPAGESEPAFGPLELARNPEIHAVTHSTMQKSEPLSIRHDFDFARIADWKLIAIENKTTKQNKIQKRKKRKRGEKKKKKRKKENKRRRLKLHFQQN